MAAKRTKAAPTDDELGELFEGLVDDAAPKKATSSGKATKAKPAAAADGDTDILAELENQLGEQPAAAFPAQQQQPSRPHTPRLGKDGAKGSPARIAAAEAVAAASRRSAESVRSSSHTTAAAPAFTPSAGSSSTDAGGGAAETEKSAAGGGDGGAGGSWWGWGGGLVATATATATAAMKQAEAAVKEIQQSDDAKKWADQVRGNVGALRGLSDELRHRALPTFTTLLHTLAPPISAHERLRIHTTHDLVGYPTLDPLIYGVFSRVMSQVEGGDLLVIQRGQESSSSLSSTAAGWKDGPWWRAGPEAGGRPRELGSVAGLVEGSKLCRAQAEGFAREYFNAQAPAGEDGFEAARRRAAETLADAVPVRTSDIFLAVQAVTVAAEAEAGLFARSGTGKEKEKEQRDAGAADDDDELVVFAVYVLDPVHDLAFSAVSQAIPSRWVRWLDNASDGGAGASNLPTPATSAGGEDNEDLLEARALAAQVGGVPEEIRDIVEGGGVDPREWAAEWLEECLELAVGVVAQRYVARRMGVGLGGGLGYTDGEGGLAKSKRRAEVAIMEGGGEIARAGLI